MMFTIGVLMGFAYVLPPGPVTVETVRRSLRGGLRAAVAVQLGAVAGDLLYALLVLGGLGGFLGWDGVRSALGVLGAGLLIALGLSTMRDSRLIAVGASAARGGAGLGGIAGDSALGHLGAGFALGVANPYAVVFWLAVGGSALQGSPAGIAGFVAGSLLASLLTALVAGQLQRPAGRRFAGWICGGCGAALLLLGAQLGYATLAQLLSA